MMHPLTVLVDELRDEAGLAGRGVEKLDHETAKVESLPVERSADLLVYRFGVAQLDWKIFREEFVGAVDGLHRDRYVIEPHPNIVGRIHAQAILPSEKCVNNESHELRSATLIRPGGNLRPYLTRASGPEAPQ